jgi:prepilin-type N-terminal cleavage/methylation domain-containing protein
MVLHRGGRSGFTLLELLIVLTIIGIMLSLLLPAVQKAREGAYRTMCQSRSAQIQNAVSNWAAAQAKRKPPPDEPPISGLVAILPYIEQNNLLLLYHEDQPWDSPANLELIPRMPSLYTCPNATIGEKGRTSYYLGQFEVNDAYAHIWTDPNPVANETFVVTKRATDVFGAHHDGGYYVGRELRQVGDGQLLPYYPWLKTP